MKFEESGFYEIQVGDDPPKSIDLYRVNNQIYELQQQHDRTSDAYSLALKELFVSHGLPPMSHKLATTIANAIIDAHTADRGKSDPAQPPSDSPS